MPHLWKPRRSGLNKLAAENGFAVDYFENTDKIDDEFLSHYQLFIQLNYPPYNWTPTAQAAFIKYIEEGRGGWIGFHHATLLGEFDGFPMWPWFSQFMGGIRFKSYIATFADGTVAVEDPSHPAMKGVHGPFPVEHEEWYTWDKSPRPNVHVLASVSEGSYKPDTPIKMGDHPVIGPMSTIRRETSISLWASRGPVRQCGVYHDLPELDLLGRSPVTCALSQRSSLQASVVDGGLFLFSA